ncbi:ATP-binding protein [Geodermatophilus sp. DSM 44513]|uniref:ATP-binding protein n=1 Tax=Geodermatophilus sp. DSM 44513 TaxID=1528104 RepID=UPI00141374C1|nr:ATP-binding protein [Geodermatophilus sp. DSM 44513]WNV75445.1 ATP-binding protein [Geodermatophilus sp. DSM 44513]
MSADHGPSLNHTDARSPGQGLVTGLRGVGKTVLLNRFSEIAEQQEWIVVEGEVTKNTNFTALLLRLTRRALLTLDAPSRWSGFGKKCAAALRGLTLNASVDGTMGISWAGFPDPEPGIADSGDLTMDMTDVIVTLGQAAAERGRGVIFLLDELQFAPAEPLGAFITALHKVVQRRLPVTCVGAGLPMLPELAGEAKSYAERLFTNSLIGPLAPSEAEYAITKPAHERGVNYEPAAVQHMINFTEGYPFFLQVFGSIVWSTAQGSDLVTADDVQRAEAIVRDELDTSFFKARVGGVTDAQRRYLRALAEAGEAEVPTGDVAATLGLRSSTQTGTVREALIRRGLVYSPRLGYTAFTVPQFGDYMRRHFQLEPHEPTRRPRNRRQPPAA